MLRPSYSRHVETASCMCQTWFTPLVVPNEQQSAFVSTTVEQHITVRWLMVASTVQCEWPFCSLTPVICVMPSHLASSNASVRVSLELIHKITLSGKSTETRHHAPCILQHNYIICWITTTLRQSSLNQHAAMSWSQVKTLTSVIGHFLLCLLQVMYKYNHLLDGKNLAFP